MSTTWISSILVTGVLSVVLPWVGMRMLAPALESSPRLVENYRGRSVHNGLGIVWVFWVGGMVLLLIGMGIASRIGYPTADVFPQDSILPMIWATLAIGAVMVIPSFVFGMIDDAYGDSRVRGFRGHLDALVHGRFTTGGLKLVGIGTAAVLAGMVIAEQAPGGVLRAAGAAVLIALSANFVNLTDLRPGRALKVYLIMLLSACAVMPFSWAGGSADTWGGALLLVVAGVGPPLAVWSSDLGERGMLGDAGANPAGALAGVFIAVWWPLWGVALLAGLLALLNVVSERTSFSSVIERTPILRTIDELGRMSVEASSPGSEST